MHESRTDLPRFKTGQTILYRGVDENGCVIDVKPVKVIEDSEGRILLWLPLGTKTKKPVLAKSSVPGQPRQWIAGKMEGGIWNYAELLIHIRPKRQHAIWVKWSAEREFLGWYINLQSNLKRSEMGFDYQDHQLDVLVDKNKSWRLKDEDELDEAVRRGRIQLDQADTIREETNALTQEIDLNRGPISENWENWSPPSQMAKPELPIDWNE